MSDWLFNLTADWMGFCVVLVTLAFWTAAAGLVLWGACRLSVDLYELGKDLFFFWRNRP